MMAFIRKRGKYWHVYFYWGGKLYSRSTKSTSKEIALKIKNEIETELAFRRFNLPYAKKITIKSFLDEYFNYAENVKSKNTIRADRFAVDKLLKVCKESDFVHTINVRKIDDLKMKLLKEMDVTSVNIILRHLRSILNTAKRWGYISENPVSRAGLIKEEKEMPRAIKRDDLIKILDYAEKYNKDFAVIIKFALLTGFRRGEIANLKWEDIDWERRAIVLKKTKSKRFRIFPLTQQIEMLLKDIKREGEYVFRYRSDSLSSIFSKISRKLGFDYKFHDLRRTFTTYLFGAGLDLKIVSLLLGHQSVTTTEKHYLEVMTEVLSAIEGIDYVKIMTMGFEGENRGERGDKKD